MLLNASSIEAFSIEGFLANRRAFSLRFGVRLVGGAACSGVDCDKRPTAVSSQLMGPCGDDVMLCVWDLNYMGCPFGRGLACVALSDNNCEVCSKTNFGLSQKRILA